MKYTPLFAAAFATIVSAMPLSVEKRAVGTLYPFQLNGTLQGPGPYTLYGGEWNVTSESNLGSSYGQGTLKSVASSLANTASLQSTANNNPSSISATSPGANGGTLNGTFTKTNTYLNWGNFNSTQWSTIFNAAVNATTLENYPGNEVLTLLVNINNKGYSQEGYLTLAFK